MSAISCSTSPPRRKPGWRFTAGLQFAFSLRGAPPSPSPGRGRCSAGPAKFYQADFHEMCAFGPRHWISRLWPRLTGRKKPFANRIREFVKEIEKIIFRKFRFCHFFRNFEKITISRNSDPIDLILKNFFIICTRHREWSAQITILISKHLRRKPERDQNGTGP